MKRICLIWLVILLAVGTILPAAAATPADPTVATAQQALDATLGTELPGAAVLIVKNGTAVMLEGFGYADLATRTPVTENTPFELGELSSAFVSMVALALAEEGRIDLDADASVYLPEAFAAKLNLSYAVTLRQLLLGRAGFGGRIHDLYFSDTLRCFQDLEEALLADVPEQIARPDTCTLYSAFGVTLAAYAMSCATQTDFALLAEQYVFAPLEMTSTHYRLPETPTGDAAKGYTALDGKRFREGAGYGYSYSGLVPATGAVSTAADLFKLFSFLLSDADSPVLSATAKAELLKVVESGVVGGSSLGFAERDGILRQSGATLCHGASLCLNPQSGDVALVLTNTAENVLLQLPQTLLPGVAVRAPGSDEGLWDMKLFEGVYATATGERRTFVGRFQMANDNYKAELNADGTLQFLGMRLRQSAPGVFVLAEGDDATVKLQFFLDEGGDVAVVSTPDGRAYMPVPFYYEESVATMSLAILMLCSLWFLLFGIGVLVHWRHHKEPNGKRRSVQYILPHVFAATEAVAVMLAVCVGGYFGTAVFAPFYTSLAVVALLAGIGASVSYVIAFLRSFFRRALHHRIAYSAIFFVIFQILIRIWAVVPL